MSQLEEAYGDQNIIGTNFNADCMKMKRLYENYGLNCLPNQQTPMSIPIQKADDRLSITRDENTKHINITIPNFIKSYKFEIYDAAGNEYSGSKTFNKPVYEDYIKIRYDHGDIFFIKIEAEIEKKGDSVPHEFIFGKNTETKKEIINKKFIQFYDTSKEYKGIIIGKFHGNEPYEEVKMDKIDEVYYDTSMKSTNIEKLVGSRNDGKVELEEDEVDKLCSFLERV